MVDSPENESAVDSAHRLLIGRIIDSTYPVGSELPGERALSKELGIARNALREALQRMNHNGWLEISQGRATRVRDYLREGDLTLLMDLLNINEPPVQLVPGLLHMWSLLAEDYTAAAVRNEPNRIIERLELYDTLVDSPEAITRAMWQLHRALIDYCDNMIYGLVFNSFANLYQRLALVTYTNSDYRQSARDFWTQFRVIIAEGEAEAAAALMRQFLIAEVDQWTHPPQPNSQFSNLDAPDEDQYEQRTANE